MQPCAKNSHALTVIVVEHDPWLQRALEQLFAEDGHHVVRVEDRGEAARLARRLDPAMILIDVPTAPVDGMSALEELRRRAADAVIVVLSATGTAGTAREAMLCGADDYVAKPVDMNALRVVVRDGLAERRRRALEHACAS